MLCIYNYLYIYICTYMYLYLYSKQCAFTYDIVHCTSLVGERERERDTYNIYDKCNDPVEAILCVHKYRTLPRYIDVPVR